MTFLSKAEIICLIKEIRNLDNSEEEIADKALAYKPISL